MFELPPRSLPKLTYVPLAEALTWLLWDHPVELPRLIEMAGKRGVSDERIRDALASEWRTLADYACRATVCIRARKHWRGEERQLFEHELRNCVFVGWRTAPACMLELSRFDFTFAGGFQSNLAGQGGGWLDPVVRRTDVLNYRKVKPRLRRELMASAEFARAQAWLRDELRSQERRTGLKWPYVAELEARFGMPKYRAEELWTQITCELGWPQRGRPRKEAGEKKPNNIAAPANFPRADRPASFPQPLTGAAPSRRMHHD